MATMTMMGGSLKKNTQTITSLAAALPAPTSPSNAATNEVRGSFACEFAPVNGFSSHLEVLLGCESAFVLEVCFFVNPIVSQTPHLSE